VEISEFGRRDNHGPLQASRKAQQSVGSFAFSRRLALIFQGVMRASARSESDVKLYFEVEAVVESSGLGWPGEIPTRRFGLGARHGDGQGSLANRG
jgi:hypothetical protein